MGDLLSEMLEGDMSVTMFILFLVCRTRNSIAVSSFDHLKNENKRPHSIISISSTSSSGSSGGASVEQQQSLLGFSHHYVSPHVQWGTSSAQGEATMLGAPQPTVLETLLDSSSLTKTCMVYTNGKGAPQTAMLEGAYILYCTDLVLYTHF